MNLRSKLLSRLLPVAVLVTIVASANEADVLEVRVSCNEARVCRFSVTVEHNDQGWDHYADRWELLSPDGEVLATRVLAHPHDHEQPFERSLGNVSIPKDILQVVVRAHDSVHEYGGVEITVDVPK